MYFNVIVLGKDVDGLLSSYMETPFNKNSKYDSYYVVTNLTKLPLKKEVSEGKDIFTIEDIEWMRSKEKLEEEKAFWNDYVLNHHPEKYEDDFSFYKKEDYLEKYKNLETFLKARKYFLGSALITPDGEWHEPDATKDVYGCLIPSKEEELKFELSAYEKWIAPLPKDTPVWLVNCHM